jgi:hypothetical protein
VSARVLSQLVALGFIILGLLAFSTRFYTRSQVQTGLQESLWRLTYSVGFDKDGPLAQMRVSLPTSTEAAEVEVEELSHTGLEGVIRETPQSQNRELHLTTDIGGPYQVTAEFDVRLRPENAWDEQNAMVTLTSGARNRFLRSEETYELAGSGIRKVLQERPRAEMTDGEYVQQLFEYCSQSLKDPRIVNEAERAETLSAASDVASALAYHQATPLGRARTLVTLCRAAKIPARLITGFELRQAESAEPHVWMEAFYGHRWVPFDPTNGFARHLPAEYVPIRRDSGDGESLVLGTGVRDVTQRYTIVRLAPPEKLLQAEMRRPSQVFDLTRLPVEMHEVMSLMLLLPLGALITAIFRNIIGIRTLGTFAPALLAMSFIYAAWSTGLVILITVLMAGYVGRKLLDRLHLLMVPRSSIVLTIIILFVVFGVSVIDYMAPASGVRAVLLPLVILTILIERFFVTAEEDGTTFAIQLVVGTFVVAAFCYLILSWEEIGQILLIYPELHFFTIAAFVWIGRYSGYRLVELWRFRDMVK